MCGISSSCHPIEDPQIFVANLPAHYDNLFLRFSYHPFEVDSGADLVSLTSPHPVGFLRRHYSTSFCAPETQRPSLPGPHTDQTRRNREHDKSKVKDDSRLPVAFCCSLALPHPTRKGREKGMEGKSQTLGTSPHGVITNKNNNPRTDHRRENVFVTAHVLHILAQHWSRATVIEGTGIQHRYRTATARGPNPRSRC